MSIAARNIKRIMSEKGLKQCAVAKKAGFNNNQFSAMLCGRKRILADHLPAIAMALNVTPNALLNDCDTVDNRTA